MLMMCTVADVYSSLHKGLTPRYIDRQTGTERNLYDVGGFVV